MYNWILCHAVLPEMAWFMVPAIAIVSAIVSSVCYLVIYFWNAKKKISLIKLFIYVFLFLFILWFLGTDRIYWQI